MRENSDSSNEDEKTSNVFDLHQRKRIRSEGPEANICTDSECEYEGSESESESEFESHSEFELDNESQNESAIYSESRNESHTHSNAKKEQKKNQKTKQKPNLFQKIESIFKKKRPKTPKKSCAYTHNLIPKKKNDAADFRVIDELELEEDYNSKKGEEYYYELGEETQHETIIESNAESDSEERGDSNLNQTIKAESKTDEEISDVKKARKAEEHVEHSKAAFDDEKTLTCRGCDVAVKEKNIFIHFA